MDVHGNAIDLQGAPHSMDQPVVILPYLSPVETINSLVFDQPEQSIWDWQFTRGRRIAVLACQPVAQLPPRQARAPEQASPW